MGHDNERAAMIYLHAISRIVAALRLAASELRLQFGAGEGNRTPTVSLGS